MAGANNQGFAAVGRGHGNGGRNSDGKYRIADILGRTVRLTDPDKTIIRGAARHRPIITPGVGR